MACLAVRGTNLHRLRKAADSGEARFCDSVRITRSYLVQYDRTVWHGATKDATKPWSATVDFQWHPGLPMRPDDRTDNPGGFQVIAYSAKSDTPDERRQ
jgi:type IV secretory pathway component VirB8